ncbi:gluconeogenesis factor YvcK family protein [Paenibacillus sp. y28]|uniref:gluconeogenesis factor YvcK family protein n=1 Tax=Paenibacillus sp. y28 TaxID=3129110 RepID=UPI003016E61D
MSEVDRELNSELPRIVVIGGGTGLSVMLRGLKEKPIDITAIVTVADDGGSSGILRSELQMPPPGDIRNVISALAEAEPMLSRMLQHRFSTGAGLAGHSLGNLILAAMKEITGDFVTGIKQLSRVLAVRGRVLPAANQSIVLKACMKDGRLIEGESQIPKAGGAIHRVFIEPSDVSPLDEALDALREADAILIGPGSLYTSIMPNLLVPGLSEMIEKSQAVKIFVCNVMTQPGETDGFTVSDHLQAIEDHVGCLHLDYVIVNDGPIPPEVENKYAEKGAKAVKLDLERVLEKGCAVIADKLVLHRTYLRHDANRLSEQIYKLVAGREEEKR